MSGLRPPAVVVVEDDPDHARIARFVLESIAPGIRVTLCGDGDAAAAAFDDLPRGALVLMDRLLRGAETFDAIVGLRARRPDATIVMLSALLNSVDRAYAIACGAADAIEKPSTLAGWRVTLGALIAAPDIGPTWHQPRAA